jgi:methylthioribose-1-phosphate isomerase
MKTIETISFAGGELRLIDQRKLPGSYELFTCRDYRDVEFAIRDMVVRGAPAIGSTAAYGVYLAALEISKQENEEKGFLRVLKEACDFLDASRPTAVNLRWGIRRMFGLAERLIREASTRETVLTSLKREADIIHQEDIATNRQMARNGAELVPQGATILTHCNTGALATAGWGTALGVVREAHIQGKDIFVYADETRPRLQGARLTAWELVQEQIPAKLIADNAAAFLMQQKKIDLIMVGADRIAGNGDTSNKIGTYMLAVCAKEHSIPFYIVAPVSTIDFEIESGAEIPIEERAAEEVSQIEGVRIAPEGIDVYNPAFDVTPASFITGIVTEKGVIFPPYTETIGALKKEG